MSRKSTLCRSRVVVGAILIGCVTCAVSLTSFINTAYVQRPAKSEQALSRADEKSGKLDADAEVGVIEIPADVAASARSVRSPGRVTPLGPGFSGESEPNNTFGTATPLVGTNVAVRGNIFPNGDIDFYSFTVAAGDRIYAATMTSFSANASTDSQLTLLNTDGTTTIEFDDDDGGFGGLSSSIAGATIPSAGTYFLRVNHFSATNQLRPYELYLRVQSGAPTPEVEGNDTPGTANPLPASGWVSGARDPAAATEQDWFSMTLNAGDTVYLSLDLDPERNVTTWNGRLGFALFGDIDNLILVVDDGGTVDTIDSEAFFFTVKTAGTYYAFVDSGTAATGGPTATYNLSVSVHPAANEGVNCTTYTSTNVPQTIGPGAGLVSSTITVPGNPRIADLDVSIQLNHAKMGDLDVHLRSPANPEGNNNGLFTDIGAAAIGGQAIMDVVFDDEAALPPLFTVMRPISYKPELAYRLNWFDGMNAGGTWTLDIRDDGAADGGTLTGWSLRICEQPAVSGSVVYSENFDGSGGTDGGFTHTGTADEWERGLPTLAATTTTDPVAAFTTCNSGTNCWKTDLDNTYNISSSQDLLSPNISLAGVSGPVTLEWAMRYQMESANFDHARVIVQQVGLPATAKTVFEFLDATMTNAPGSPAVNIGASAGWGRYRADISSFAGQNIEVIFHLDSDSSVNFGGMAIDDVAVYGTSTPTGGSVQFSSATYSVAENVGTGIATITVTRTGGSAGAASVQFMTASGTATGGAAPCSGGEDYSDVAGTLNWPDGNSTPQTFNVPICNESFVEGTETVNLSLFNAVPATLGTPNAAVLDITNDDAVSAGQIIISEFRLRGPGGAEDEFIEIYNTAPAAQTVTSSDASAGYGVAASDGVLRCTIPNGTVIPARGHFLCVNSDGYSLGLHPGGNSPVSTDEPEVKPLKPGGNTKPLRLGSPPGDGPPLLVPTATGDATYTTDIPDNVGIALFSSTTTFSAGTRLDAVGSSTEFNLLYKEGAGYAALAAASLEHSWIRDPCGKGGSASIFGPCPTLGLPKDTDNNAADLVFVDTNGSVGNRLGAPGPENLTAPTQRNGVFSVVLLDATVSNTLPPNRVRDLTSDPVNNSISGTLSIRRRVTNNTGVPVTRLRFRIVDISTFSAPSGIADLRARTSSAVVVGGINDAATCFASTGSATTPCSVTVQGTTLEVPPAQPLGGGFNSTISAGTIGTGTPLAPGASINVQFLLGVQQTGSFKFFINVEALP